jgi:hypothetical protein
MIFRFFKRKARIFTIYLIIFIVSAILAPGAYVAFIILVYGSSMIAVIPIFLAAILSFLTVRYGVLSIKGLKIKREIEILQKNKNTKRLLEIVIDGKGTTYKTSVRYILSIYALVDLMCEDVYPFLLSHYYHYRVREKKIPKLFEEALILFSNQYGDGDYKTIAETHLDDLQYLIEQKNSQSYKN